ncbi:hypothetical protein CEP52_006279 [Fusarium oligoseptatum]|uniref:Uncharacterized protein n=1 Tax=Fusarium oligoseptatum TaxID=2604345 RepID=A0A428TTW6_9HYPO|nr:hypothetical protein CEP52_006279 [Fusarium oligoseptatum]
MMLQPYHTGQGFSGIFALSQDCCQSVGTLPAVYWSNQLAYGGNYAAYMIKAFRILRTMGLLLLIGGDYRVDTCSKSHCNKADGDSVIVMPPMADSAFVGI